MKTKTILIAFAFLLSGAPSAQAQKKIEFAKLSEYVNDRDHRRNGEGLVVINAPTVDEVTYIKGYQLYTFTADDEGVRQTFYTSASVAKSLRLNSNSRAVLMSITCVLIEIASDQDTYRAPFATKIEGINMDGEIVWTVKGPPPTKLKFK